MVPYFDEIKKNLGSILRERVSGFKSFRIGIVLYKDYWPDEYITKKYPFTSDIAKIEQIAKSVDPYGGGDIPEAEIEALYSAATEFDWSADRRQVLVLTDASPHPIPRGKILFDDVVREAAARRIEMDSIIEPTVLAAPAPVGWEYENAARRIAFLVASGVSVRLLALAEASDPERARIEAESEGQMTARLAPDPRLTLIGATVFDGEKSAGSAGVAASDADALAAARAAGANYLLLSRTLASWQEAAAGPAALSETDSRLLEAATGKELERNVVWRALSQSASASKIETEFVNGVRLK